MLRESVYIVLLVHINMMVQSRAMTSDIPAVFLTVTETSTEKLG